jgi:hypothetical protein
MINIQLSEGQYKALLKILSDAHEEASNCGCNDSDESELSVFTHEEREAILRTSGVKYFRAMKKEWEENKEELGTWEEELAKGWGLFNMSHIDYLIDVIKKQRKGQKS